MFTEANQCKKLGLKFDTNRYLYKSCFGLLKNKIRRVLQGQIVSKNYTHVQKSFLPGQMVIFTAASALLGFGCLGFSKKHLMSESKDHKLAQFTNFRQKQTHLQVNVQRSLQMFQNQQNQLKEEHIQEKVGKKSKKISLTFRFSFDLLPHLILLGLVLKGLKNIRQPRKYIGLSLGLVLWAYTYPKVYCGYYMACNYFIKDTIMPTINTYLKQKQLQNFKWDDINLLNFQMNQQQSL